MSRAVCWPSGVIATALIAPIVYVKAVDERAVALTPPPPRLPVAAAAPLDEARVDEAEADDLVERSAPPAGGYVTHRRHEPPMTAGIAQNWWPRLLLSRKLAAVLRATSGERDLRHRSPGCGSAFDLQPHGAAHLEGPARRQPPHRATAGQQGLVPPANRRDRARQHRHVSTEAVSASRWRRPLWHSSSKTTSSTIALVGIPQLRSSSMSRAVVAQRRHAASTITIPTRRPPPCDA